MYSTLFFNVFKKYLFPGLCGKETNNHDTYSVREKTALEY